MKKIILLLGVMLLNTGSSFAVEIPEIMRETMSHETGMPSLLNLVVSMVLVIGLIYATGWIYSKLNVINKNQLNKAGLIEDSQNKFKVIQSMPLGQQRYLYSIQMNNKTLLVGSTPTQISLIKEFSSDEEIDGTTLSESVQSLTQEEEKKPSSVNIDELYKKYKN